MKLFVSTDHPAVWPTGVASIIVAENEDEARALLNTALHERRLYGPFTLREVSLTEPAAHVLCDGDY